MYIPYELEKALPHFHWVTTKLRCTLQGMLADWTAHYVTPFHVATRAGKGKWTECCGHTDVDESGKISTDKQGKRLYKRPSDCRKKPPLKVERKQLSFIKWWRCEMSVTPLSFFHVCNDWILDRTIFYEHWILTKPYERGPEFAKPLKIETNIKL